MPAPGFELAGLSQPVRLDQYKGKVVYLDFWASWCGPCRQSFPWMNAVQKKWAAQGLVVLGVNLDAKAADAAQFLQAHPAEFTVAFDPKGQTPALYQVKGMPTSVLIGRNGKVLFQHAGFRPSDTAALEARMAAALQGQP